MPAGRYGNPNFNNRLNRTLWNENLKFLKMVGAIKTNVKTDAVRLLMNIASIPHFKNKIK